MDFLPETTTWLLRIWLSLWERLVKKSPKDFGNSWIWPERTKIRRVNIDSGESKIDQVNLEMTIITRIRLEDLRKIITLLTTISKIIMEVLILSLTVKAVITIIQAPVIVIITQITTTLMVTKVIISTIRTAKAQIQLGIEMISPRLLLMEEMIFHTPTETQIRWVTMVVINHKEKPLTQLP
jgi:hypothetical protein